MTVTSDINLKKDYFKFTTSRAPFMFVNNHLQYFKTELVYIVNPQVLKHIDST